VPAQVHLEEAVLGVHVALHAHEVGRVVRVDLRDAAIVAHDLHRALEPGQRHLAAAVRQRSPHEGHDEHDDDHERDHDDRGRPEAGQSKGAAASHGRDSNGPRARVRWALARRRPEACGRRRRLWTKRAARPGGEAPPIGW
jgi:hypothetical protein